MKEKNITIKEVNQVFITKKFTDDEKVNAYLNQVFKEIILIETKSELILGQKFEEVFQRLKKEKSGLYKDFVAETGFNYRTTLRYRTRYKIYIELSNLNYKKASQLVAFLPIEYLEKLSSLSKKEEVKKYLYEKFSNNNLTMQDMKNLINFEVTSINIKITEEREITYTTSFVEEKKEKKGISNFIKNIINSFKIYFFKIFSYFHHSKEELI